MFLIITKTDINTVVVLSFIFGKPRLNTEWAVVFTSSMTSASNSIFGEKLDKKFGGFLVLKTKQNINTTSKKLLGIAGRSKCPSLINIL